MFGNGLWGFEVMSGSMAATAVRKAAALCTGL
jgi:hypothetical protein